ncbi:MAG: peptidoglycan-binding protein [Armatimonadetes bacterium]|nr:peptidoglycan-binding protein [Armatimonadota bacterium]
MRLYLWLLLLGTSLLTAGCPTGPSALRTPAGGPPEELGEVSGLEHRLRAEISGERRVAVRLANQDFPESGELVRSLQPLSGGRDRLPMTHLPAAPRELTDSGVADGTAYYYGVLRGGKLVDEVRVDVPGRELPALAEPRLVVDKVEYTLTVLDGERVVKRYPIALGSEPGKRKLCRDNASTPEGFYTIMGLQPEATFHRAYDIDYPNDVDRVRYRFAQRHQKLGDPGIGGEIQIHGRGIHSNWTFGCVALRDQDMDELFAHPEIDAGTEVLILGRDITAEDANAIRASRSPEAVEVIQRRLVAEGFATPVDGTLGESTEEALGRYQLAHGLPVTCQLDSRTLARLSP